jgi:hypothetical protein
MIYCPVRGMGEGPPYIHNEVCLHVIWLSHDHIQHRGHALKLQAPSPLSSRTLERRRGKSPLLRCQPNEPTPHKSVDYRAFRSQTATEGKFEIFAQ